MKLKAVRFSSQEDSSSGLLFDATNDMDFLCYTLEDERRKDKKFGETRVPAGVYSIKLRDEGGMTKRYAAKYKDMHKGMLCIHNAPDWKIVTPDMTFQYVLIHVGNTDEHTAGCLIIGDTQENNILKKDGFIGKSVQAYKRVYPLIVKALEAGEEVSIEYIDLD
ncbi:hypothetical protein [uncultured virus]|uniref:DUF5675 domain-containing protein n=1 Tax=uncultured virus TaxID=340016 RepID=A0A218MMJ9_9VIRU|nr:hypothetical protein [uncultured virus]